MGGIDRLLEALAKRLPAASTLEDAQAALRAAAESLPDAKKKTRERLQKTERRYVNDLLNRVRAAAAQRGELEPAAGKSEAAAEPDQEDSEAEAEAVAAERQPEEEGGGLGAAAYAGLSPEDPAACVKRCAALLREALASLTPARRAAEAIGGLVGLLSLEGLGAESELDFDAEVAASCAELAPLASAALAGAGDGEHALVWQRFLAFLLLAPCRIHSESPNEEDEKAADALAARAGGLAALLGSPAAARGALRLAFASFAGSEAPSGKLFCRMGFALPPLVRLAFGEDAAKAAPPPHRSDLAALLHTFRMVALCAATPAAGAEEAAVPAARPPEPALRACRGELRAALAARFDVVPLLPELRGLAEGMEGPRAKGLRKRLRAEGAAAKSRDFAAAALAEVVELGAATLEPAALDRLVGFAGLPQSAVDEALGVDARAAAARATGELFFEDVAGGQGPAAKRRRREPAAAAAGASAAAVAEAAAAVAARSFGSIDGIETMRAEDSGEEAEAAAEVTTPKKGKKQAAMEEEDAGGASPALLPAGASPASPASAAEGTPGRRTRRRRKSAPEAPL